MPSPSPIGSGSAPAAEDVPDASFAAVARAVRFLREHATEQPDLDAVAAAAGLGRFALERAFQRLAGTTPGRFLAVLTRDAALRRLRESAGVLDAALDVGLSGPGRLHDLLVRCDALTPGEAARAGAGVAASLGRASTPFGPAVLGWTARGVCALRFEDDDPARTLAEVRAAWPAAAWSRDDAGAAALAARAFGEGERPTLHLRGTNFQLQVWRALLAIPPGSVATHGRLAAAIGRPGAARAVGTAVGANPIAVLVPCHRILRESGDLGGYRWGLERKAVLLAREA